MTKKYATDSKENTRPKNWNKNPAYDREVLSDESPSGLAYLELLWEKRIENFKETHDMTVKENKSILSNLKEYYGMVQQEIFSRTMNSMATKTNSDFELDYDSENGLIFDGDGNLIATVEFNELENGTITRNLEGEVLGVNWGQESLHKTPKLKLSQKDRYTDWEYWKDDKLL